MKKKILIIPSWYPNINNNLLGNFFQEQADLLNTNGYDVRILFGRIIFTNTITILKNKLRNYFFLKKSPLRDDYLIQKPPAFSFSIFQLSEWNEEKKYNSICIEYVNAFNEVVKDGWIPDLIHAQCTVDAGIISSHLSDIYKIPFVIIEHQVFLLNNYSSFKQKLIKNSLEKALRVGAVSNHQKRCILMNSINCDPQIIWNYVNEDAFKAIALRSNLKFRIITISYPSFIKDMNTFFKSIFVFSQICKEEFEVIVIGNNSFKNLENANCSVFESLANKYNVFSFCQFIPFLPRDKISEILNTANVFVSTSIAETFGVAVREAMLCGLPIVTTKSGGVEDSINDKNGVMVNIGDYREIAESLVKIKRGVLKFDPHYIRELTISQCGKNAYLNKMNYFYS
ncbi:glycosyltransferase [Cyclobacteriaceae bacterium YHN15]|nr:glycosyltransferase [Cyclobacteriaceae bacterium YHN15]